MELIAALLAVIATLLVMQRNQMHERRLAVFSIEVEELKQHFRAANRMERALGEHYTNVLQSLKGSREYKQLERSRIREEIGAAFRELEEPFLAANEAFLEKRLHFYRVSGIFYHYLETETDVREIMMRSFEYTRMKNEYVEVITNGLSNFRVGKDVYTPDEEQK